MSADTNKQLGQRVKYLRKQKGLSQEKLAEALNMATTSLSYIETGRGFMTLDTLENMAKVLEVEPYEIFQFITIKTNQDMFDFIIGKINSIKDDNEKLKIMYSIVKNIL